MLKSAQIVKVTGKAGRAYATDLFGRQFLIDLFYTSMAGLAFMKKTHVGDVVTPQTAEWIFTPQTIGAYDKVERAELLESMAVWELQHIEHRKAAAQQRANDTEIDAALNAPR